MLRPRLSVTVVTATALAALPPADFIRVVCGVPEVGGLPGAAADDENGEAEIVLVPRLLGVGAGGGDGPEPEDRGDSGVWVGVSGDGAAPQ